jgi:hypothetical protein
MEFGDDGGFDGSGQEVKEEGHQLVHGDNTDDNLKCCSCCGAGGVAKKAKYCGDCKKALNNLTNQAKKGSPEEKARFEKVRKEAGPSLNALILAYLEETRESRGRGVARGKVDIISVSWRLSVHDRSSMCRGDR